MQGIKTKGNRTLAKIYLFQLILLDELIDDGHRITIAFEPVYEPLWGFKIQFSSSIIFVLK